MSKEMNKQILIGVPLALIVCGCAQLTMNKLQSHDEAEWRAALVEIQKDDVNLLNLNNGTPKSGPEKLGLVAMNKAITYHYGSEVSYPSPVRRGAIDALGDMLSSSAVYKRDGHKISELAFDQLVDIYTKIKDDEIRQEVIKVFDNPEGYQRLLNAPNDGYHGYRSNKSVGNVLAACSDARHSFMFDYYCAENAPLLAGEAYLQIPTPTLEQSKKALVFCREERELSDAQTLAATRVPEKDMRDLLTGLRERDPKTYWFIWSKCATADEALNVYNSKADTPKKVLAVGRLGNEEMLTEIANGENDKLAIAAVRALYNTAILVEIACDKKRDTEVRMSALKRLVDRDLILKNMNADIDGITKAIFSFDYTSDLSDAYNCAVEGLSNADNYTENVKKIKDVADVRVKQIVADGESVKDDTFCCDGIRLGMYNWELKFLNSVRGLSSGVYCQEDIKNKGEFDLWRHLHPRENVSSFFDDKEKQSRVTELYFWGDGIKNILGISGTTIEAVKDVFTERYGDRDDIIFLTWHGKVLIYATTWGGTLPPRYKGRDATPEEVLLLQKENIQKAGEIKGYVQAFITNNRTPRANKGDVYKVADSLDLSTSWEPKYASCNCSLVVKQAVNGGVVVGCIQEYQKVRTGTNVRTNGPGIPVYSEFRFPNRIFVKTTKKFADGDRFDMTLLKYIGTTTHHGLNGAKTTMHSFEPYQESYHK